jgi:peptidoglycan/LPS O-acetylase OafA/YrhL
VPLEGQWQRQHSRIRDAPRREVRVLAAVAALVLVAAAVALYASLHHGTPKAAAGCVDIVAPSTTGGATLHACGADAARWCQSQAGQTDRVARVTLAACAQAGYR